MVTYTIETNFPGGAVRSQLGIPTRFGATALSWAGVPLAPQSLATGEVLVDFTIDDLVQLERALDSAPPFQFENTIVFSADGDTWSSQTSRQIAGPTSMINHLALSQTHALAIAQDERSVFGGPPGELVAWVAPISDQ